MLRQAGVFQFRQAIDARPAGAGLERVAGVKTDRTCLLSFNSLAVSQFYAEAVRNRKRLLSVAANTPAPAR